METNAILEGFEPQKDNLPYPAPFILSSVERSVCRFGNGGTEDERIAFVKRRHLEANLKAIAGELGMDEAEQKRFLDYWCCARGNELRAEGDPYFDLRQRAVSWMERARPQNKTQQSRVEKYAESARQFFQNAQAVPPGPEDAPGFGYADIPDEQ